MGGAASARREVRGVLALLLGAHVAACTGEPATYEARSADGRLLARSPAAIAITEDRRAAPLEDAALALSVSATYTIVASPAREGEAPWVEVALALPQIPVTLPAVAPDGRALPPSTTTGLARRVPLLLADGELDVPVARLEGPDDEGEELALLEAAVRVGTTVAAAELPLVVSLQPPAEAAVGTPFQAPFAALLEDDAGLGLRVVRLLVTPTALEGPLVHVGASPVVDAQPLAVDQAIVARPRFRCLEEGEGTVGLTVDALLAVSLPAPAEVAVRATLAVPVTCAPEEDPPPTPRAPERLLSLNPPELSFSHSFERPDCPDQLGGVFLNNESDGPITWSADPLPEVTLERTSGSIEAGGSDFVNVSYPCDVRSSFAVELPVVATDASGATWIEHLPIDGDIAPGPFVQRELVVLEPVGSAATRTIFLGLPIGAGATVIATELFVEELGGPLPTVLWQTVAVTLLSEGFWEDPDFYGIVLELDGSMREDEWAVYHLWYSVEYTHAATP